MTSSSGNIFRVTGPLTNASDAEFWIFFDLRLNKRLSKQPIGRWFETPSRSLWRHCNQQMNRRLWDGRQVVTFESVHCALKNWQYTRVPSLRIAKTTINFQRKCVLPSQNFSHNMAEQSFKHWHFSLIFLVIWRLHLETIFQTFTTTKSES